MRDAAKSERRSRRWFRRIFPAFNRVNDIVLLALFGWEISLVGSGCLSMNFEYHLNPIYFICFDLHTIQTEAGTESK